MEECTKKSQTQADLLRKKLAYYSIQEDHEQSNIISETPSDLIDSLPQDEQNFNNETEFSPLTNFQNNPPNNTQNDQKSSKEEGEMKRNSEKNKIEKNKIEKNKNNEIIWGDIIEFDDVNVPKFPLNAFPREIGEYLYWLSKSTQTSPEMGGVLMLGVLALCNQMKYVVKINSSYSETLSLYTVAVAEPGERKSAVVKLITEPIRDYQNHYNFEHKDEIIINQSEFECLQQRYEKLKKRFSQDDNDKLKQQLKDVAIKLKNFKKIYPLELCADNVTTEKLIDLMDKQGGKMAIISSEGGIFRTFGSTYNKIVDIDPYLKSHDGDSISFKRVQEGRTNDLKTTALTMIITTQPKRINDFINNEDFRESGLVARFLITLCKSMLEEQSADFLDIPTEITQNYKKLLFRLLETKSYNEPLFLSDEAKDEYKEYFKIVNKKMQNEWYFMKNFSSKAVGTMLRIAGLLHTCLYDNPKNYEISKDTVQNAVLIMGCLGKHMEKVYKNCGLHKDYADAKYILSWIRSSMRNSKKCEISKRDLFQHFHSKFGKVSEMEVPLRILTEKNYIKIRKTHTGGRPSENIFFNPKICSLKSLETSLVRDDTTNTFESFDTENLQSEISNPKEFSI